MSWTIDGTRFVSHGILEELPRALRARTDVADCVITRLPDEIGTCSTSTPASTASPTSPSRSAG